MVSQSIIKKWQQFNNWSVQSIQKQWRLVCCFSSQPHLNQPQFNNFNLLISKQKPGVFREKQQTTLTVVTPGNPPKKTSNNI